MSTKRIEFNFQLLPKVVMPSSEAIQEENIPAIASFRLELQEYYRDRLNVLFTYQKVVPVLLFCILLFSLSQFPFWISIPILAIIIMGHLIIRRQIRLITLGMIITDSFLEGMIEQSYNF